MAIMDTRLITGTERMSDTYLAFRQFIETSEDPPLGQLVRAGCKHDPGDKVIAAYDAPFPSPESKSGARALPLLRPMSPDTPTAVTGRRIRDALAPDPGPKLVLWADVDPVIPASVGEELAKLLCIDPPVPIRDASHFLQEDAGDEVGRVIADWLG
jgi:haloalkane dehalogenase